MFYIIIYKKNLKIFIELIIYIRKVDSIILFKNALCMAPNDSIETLNSTKTVLKPKNIFFWILINFVFTENVLKKIDWIFSYVINWNHILITYVNNFYQNLNQITKINKRGSRRTAVPGCFLEKLFWAIWKFCWKHRLWRNFFRETSCKTSIIISSL